MTIKAFIFDMDGVLIDSEPLHFAADTAMLRQLGVTPPDNYLNQYVGRENRAMWVQIKQDFHLARNTDEILKEQLKTKLRLLAEGDFSPIPGVPELMQALKERNIRIGLASSSSRTFIQAVIRKLLLQEWIDVWESGDEVTRGKPAPDIFLKVAELLQVHPRECVAIEDSATGVTAAKAAGMYCIGYQNPNSGDQDLHRADIVIDSIADINLETLPK